MSVLDKDLETSKRRIIHSKLAQTPESVAKVHKPLEWDSLGDVGYDQLTSNINVSYLEKFLLPQLINIKKLPGLTYFKKRF